MNQPEPQKVRRVRQRPRIVEVVHVERLTPHMTRVVFAGEELEGFATRGPAEHLKVNFPLQVNRRWCSRNGDPKGRSFTRGSNDL